MMLSKPIALGVAVVAVVASAAVMLSTRAVRPAADIAQATSHVPSSDGPHNPPVRPQRGAPNNPGQDTELPPNEQPSEAGDGGGGSGNGGGQDTRGNGGPRNRVPGHRQERAKNGSYMTTFAGFYRGSGTAEVSTDKVSIRAALTTGDGRTGDLVANNLVVEGPYFYGTGTAMGETVQVSGRVDAARASRIIATILGGDGRASRAVGNLPSSQDNGDEDWDQSRNGNGSGNGGGGGGGAGK